LPTALLAIGLSLVVVGPAFPQEPSEGDLRALRFYLDQGEPGSVRAELQRLRSAFPEWVPPENLDDLMAASGPDVVGRIYDLIASGDFAAARALIADTDARFSGWSPPADMLELLSLSEAQRDFDLAVSAGDTAGVIRMARGIPALLSCERVNNAWELAEAHRRGGETDEALRVYRAVVGACDAVDTLVATLEKADEIASLAELATLSDAAQTQAPTAMQEIRATEDRLRLGRAAERRWLNGESQIALSEAPESEAAPPTTQADERPAPASRAPVAVAPPPARPTSSGSGSAGGGLSAVQRAAEQGDWARCLALSANTTQAAVLYQRGWCAYNLDRPLEAITAFEASINRLGSSEQRRDAAYGLLLSMLSLNMTEQAARLAAAAPLTRSQRIAVEGQILDQRGVAAYERGDYARAVAFFRAHTHLTGARRRDLALLEGYSLLNLGDRLGARSIFRDLHSQLATDATRRALRAVD